MSNINSADLTWMFIERTLDEKVILLRELIFYLENALTDDIQTPHRIRQIRLLRESIRNGLAMAKKEARTVGRRG
jgi:hypothetical protein